MVRGYPSVAMYHCQAELCIDKSELNNHLNKSIIFHKQNTQKRIEIKFTLLSGRTKGKIHMLKTKAPFKTFPNPSQHVHYGKFFSQETYVPKSLNTISLNCVSIFSSNIMFTSK